MQLAKLKVTAPTVPKSVAPALQEFATFVASLVTDLSGLTRGSKAHGIIHSAGVIIA